MPIITIRGQLGSGAPEIGKLIAEKLHIDYVDRDIIAKVARLLKMHRLDVIAKEMPPSTLSGRIRKALGRGSAIRGGYAIGSGYEGVYLPTWKISLEDTQYLTGLKSVINELAESNSIVIVGRGSQFILKDHIKALHVLIIAPLKKRIQLIMDEMKIGEKAAKEQIKRVDGSRLEFTRKYFKAELEDPLNYDLVINTEHLTFEDVTLVIVDALRSKERTN